jgi:quercetin dioxygenase-like cupin family protein
MRWSFWPWKKKTPLVQVVANRVPKPWGYEYIFALTEHYAGKVLHVNKGHALSRQYHRKKTETILVFHGRVRVRIGNARRWNILERGAAIHLKPRIIHEIEALDDSDLFEVSTPELDDVVRLKDRYGRTK